MIKKLSIALLLMLVLAGAQAQEGYQIKLTLKSYRNAQVYLGYYYGKLKAVADSAMLDAQGSAVFHGHTKLAGGIYFIVSPRREILFEVLIDQQQHFSILADTAVAGTTQVEYTGSPDNQLFRSYTQYMARQGKALSETQAALATARTAADSSQLQQKIKTLNREVADYRQDVESKHPHSILSVMLNALKEPQVPPPPAGSKDSLFAFHYYKAHYWDGISFTDDRLIRTPFFEPRLDKYFKDLVAPEPDSINQEVDHLLLESRVNKEMFKYLLVHFTQKYINPEYMGQDAVFVHLFDKYINAGQADFFTEKYRKFVNDRAYSLMANLLGQPASELIFTDTTDQVQTLYQIQASFVLVCFWDATCSHCQETIPKIDSIYQAKWKAEGVKVMGVMIEGGKEPWLKFIRDHHLVDWIHVYQTKAQKDAETATNRPGFRQLYDVYQTPTVYLLDKDKRIIAKKLTYQQFDQVIDLKLKQAKSH